MSTVWVIEYKLSSKKRWEIWSVHVFREWAWQKAREARAAFPDKRFRTVSYQRAVR